MLMSFIVLQIPELYFPWGKCTTSPKRPSLAPLSQAAETLSFLQDSPAKEKTWPEFGGKSTELRRDDHPNIDKRERDIYI